MTISKEDLILKQLSEVSSDIKEIRKESKIHGESLVRLEQSITSKDVQCKLIHLSLDKRIDSLEDFEEKTGTTNIAELKSKNDKIANWKEWGIRLLLAVPISIFTGAVVIFIKGCGG